MGDGNFGLVYKAQLSVGVVVVVKKLSPDAFQGFREFTAEMETLSRLRHPQHRQDTRFSLWTLKAGGATGFALVTALCIAIHQRTRDWAPGTCTNTSSWLSLYENFSTTSTKDNGV
ncbi:hypothetical protein Fmac_014726 [Flemingia macrophylla]|uniref:Uncharacterized protein n=1 Tax=Flemingia macrophylla TaxID=520843 RepID=A0ABD1MDC7_9FABA